MIGKYGKNLKVVITTKTDENWKPFGCWFSVKKYLPDAEILMLIENKNAFDIEWLHRLKINFKLFDAFDPNDETSNKLELLLKKNITPPCLVLPSESFVTREISFIKNEDKNFSSKNKDVWFIKHANFLKLLENYRLKNIPPFFEICKELACDINENDICFATTYKKGYSCWINTNEDCPFVKQELIKEATTVNVWKAIEIWRDAADLYNHVI